MAEWRDVVEAKSYYGHFIFKNSGKRGEEGFGHRMPREDMGRRERDDRKATTEVACSIAV